MNPHFLAEIEQARQAGTKRLLVHIKDLDELVAFALEQQDRRRAMCNGAIVGFLKPAEFKALEASEASGDRLSKRKTTNFCVPLYSRPQEVFPRIPKVKPCSQSAPLTENPTSAVQMSPPSSESAPGEPRSMSS